MIKGEILNKFHTFIIKSGIILMLLLFSTSKIVYAVDTVPTEEQKQEYEQRKRLPVDTNMIQDWPQGPIIGAESAIVMEVDTGAVLYSKNIDESLFPASITKMMTALLVMDNCSLSDVVTFSDTAINNTEWGSSRIGIQAGEQLTVEQCLYGLLLGSANEVAYGLAEQVGGDLDTFVGMMNEKAAELGCTHTHFVNASGLPDDQHYVSAGDMALIAREFFKNETLSLISGTYTYTIPATNKVNQERPLDNHHKMVTGKKYAYEGIIGGKTGFTSVARQTLVTCAQKNGMKLICVVMKDESPNQFLDSIDLLDYGFEQFQKLPIADNENRYDLNSRTFFNTKLDVMGSSRSILSLNKSGYIIIPKTMEFSDANVTVNYMDNDSNAIARIIYSVGGNYVGSTTIDYATDVKTFEFAKILTDETDKEPQKVVKDTKVVFVSIKQVIFSVIKVLLVLLLIFIIVGLVHRYVSSAKRKKMLDRKRYKSRSENSSKHRRAYKKRSENKRRKTQDVTQNKSGRSIYQEMMQRSENMNSGDFDEIGINKSAFTGFDDDDSDDDFDIGFEKSYLDYESKEIDIFEDDDRPLW